MVLFPIKIVLKKKTSGAGFFPATVCVYLRVMSMYSVQIWVHKPKETMNTVLCVSHQRHSYHPTIQSIPHWLSRIDWYCTCIYPFWCIYPDILSQFISFTIATIEDIDWLTMKIRIDIICLVHLKIVCHWSRWHAKDGPFWKQQERPPYGAKNTQEYDEQHGRWWWQKKDRDQIWSGWLYVKNR